MTHHEQDIMELNFEIIAHQHDAMFDDYEDGTSQSYDVATIRILTGPQTGRTYHVYVPSGGPESEAWRQTGSALAADVRPEDLGDQDVLFSGAFVLKEGGQ
ncbi:hypothetical protein [Rhodovulum strictum]|uniref:Uncharacterized protein n=1 Tax=Rhodovulum strictum TaxID=58314 RepID=A0A844B1M3_9RHOB|nr:hypothetical protein [Rhodovulum strictum]MRH20021.1 hypothetical protein [Rhodovulum strictum]